MGDYAGKDARTARLEGVSLPWTLRPYIGAVS